MRRPRGDRLECAAIVPQHLRSLLQTQAQPALPTSEEHDNHAASHCPSGQHSVPVHRSVQGFRVGGGGLMRKPGKGRNTRCLQAALPGKLLQDPCQLCHPPSGQQPVSSFHRTAGRQFSETADESEQLESTVFLPAVLCMPSAARQAKHRHETALHNQAAAITMHPMLAKPWTSSAQPHSTATDKPA